MGICRTGNGAGCGSGWCGTRRGTSPGAAPADVPGGPGQVAHRTHGASTLGRGAASLQAMHWERQRTAFLNPLVRSGHLQAQCLPDPGKPLLGAQATPATSSGAAHKEHLAACSGLLSTALSAASNTAGVSERPSPTHPALP